MLSAALQDSMLAALVTACICNVGKSIWKAVRNRRRKAEEGDGTGATYSCCCVREKPYDPSDEPPAIRRRESRLQQ